MVVVTQHYFPKLETRWAEGLFTEYMGRRIHESVSVLGGGMELSPAVRI